MFLKGLRTQYISRESLNEANEARKNEDINKIIDIGRVRAEEESGTCQKCAGFEKALFVSNIRLPTGQSYQDFETCSLSPISSVPNLSMEQEEKDKKFLKPDMQKFVLEKDETNLKNKNKMDLVQELKKFSFLYEKKVSSEIIPNLSKSSVLACALESLKGLSTPRHNEKIQEAPFLKKICQVVTKDSYFPNLFSHKQPLCVTGSPMDFPGDPIKRPLVSETQFQNELRNNKPPSIIPLIFNKDSENINPGYNDTELLCENEKKLISRFNTPGAPFYRRNMF